MMNGEHRQARKLRLEARRRMKDEDLLVILEVEFLEKGSHGFSSYPLCGNNLQIRFAG
jgi:hypothetical protein